LIVIDASLAAAWLLHEADAVPTAALVGMLATESILVPPHWPTELGNALRRAVRTKRIAAADVDPMIERLTLLDITVNPPAAASDIGLFVHFALDHGMSVYDAAYVRLAAARRVPLATLDDAMKAAARKIGVAVRPA
jgi:predicted nucleic acid-binding protein